MNIKHKSKCERENSKNKSQTQQQHKKVNIKANMITEIYQKNTLLHRSEFKNSDKIRRTVTSSHFVTKFYSIIKFSKLTLFCNCCPTFSNFEGEHFLEFQQFLIFFRNYLYEISLILNFPEISERILLIFPGNCFRKVDKNIRKIRSDLELEET